MGGKWYICTYMDEKPWICQVYSGKREVLAIADTEKEIKRLLPIELAKWRRRMNRYHGRNWRSVVFPNGESVK